jgi:hypothetical protein
VQSILKASLALTFADGSFRHTIDIWPVMMFSWSMLSLVDIVCYLVVFFAFKRIYYESTTGAARRAIIKGHGCKPVHHYRHQGILGKLLGLDIIRQQIKDDKDGRTFEGARDLLFKDRNTIQIKSLGIERKLPAEGVHRHQRRSSISLLCLGTNSNSYRDG